MASHPGQDKKGVLVQKRPFPRKSKKHLNKSPLSVFQMKGLGRRTGTEKSEMGRAER